MNEIGIHTEAEVTLETSKGAVEVDVFGVDQNSLKTSDILLDVKIEHMVPIGHLSLQLAT